MNKNINLLKIKTAAGQRPATDLERCVFFILLDNGKVSSRKMISASRRLKLCASCSDGHRVIAMAEKLQALGLVERERQEGEYFWSLSRKAVEKIKK